MSDLLNKASLVMVPSGYKEDTVYSVVPSDGSGDLAFTRASNGTRINSAGLVEDCPWNLVQNSENFDAVWTKYNGATVTVNSIVAPNGTTTADLLISGSSQEIYSTNMPKVAEELYYTFSCYAKFYNTNVFGMVCSDFATSGSVGTFNLSTQSATFATGATWSNVSASMESVGNGWYRCILSGKSPATTGLYLSLYTTGTNNVSGVYIWGAQTNIGSTAKPYFPTTDRLNVPRLTYQNGGGGCPSLLLEKQSTNLVSYSNGFDNAYWTKTSQGVGSNAVITPNYTTSPDGTNNAFRFQCNLNGGTTTNDRSWMLASFTAQATSTISIYIKLNSAGTKTFIFSDSGGNTKTISNTDWQRIDRISSGAGGEFRIGLIGGLGTSDTLDCSIAFAQAESGSYPTSYIPTTSSSATRVADECKKTGISSLIGQTEGVMFYDGYLGNETSEIYAFLQQSLGNIITSSMYLQYTGGQITWLGWDSSTTQQWAIGGGGYALGQRIKIAGAYKANDIVLYVNGTQIGTDTSATVPTCTALQLGVYPALPSDNVYRISKPINQVALFPTRLTNAELASLTTI